jgi:uncharacterized protein
MSPLMVLLGIQIALGAFDNLWHHEITEALPGRREARVELALHAGRELSYAVLFAGLAWWEWHGAWSAAVVALLVIEIVLTLADFVVEDGTRRLPKTERVLHTLLAVNFGALLAGFAPTLLAWARLPTTVVGVDHGLASWLLTAAVFGLLAWSVRNALAARRHFAPPGWQRHDLRAGRRPNSKRVLVTGATGFIGRKLVYRLIERGDRVIVFARNASKAADWFGPHAEIVTNLAAIAPTTRIDAIVNLAGESIAGGLWTRRRRRLLLDSRLTVTSALLELVARLATRPKTWVNASAIGYYGAEGDEPLHEKCSGGRGFQAELCRRWEEAAARAAAHGVKVSALRIGVVLGSDGGALPALARPIRLFAGTTLGSGRQWFSWIHLDDLLRVVLFALDQETLAGPLNATAPEPVRHGELMATIAATLRRPLWPMRVPAPLLRAILGELAELFVDGQRVQPERLRALGFEFRYPTIDAALEQALGRTADAVPRVSGAP